MLTKLEFSHDKELKIPASYQLGKKDRKPLGDNR